MFVPSGSLISGERGELILDFWDRRVEEPIESKEWIKNKTIEQRLLHIDD